MPMISRNTTRGMFLVFGLLLPLTSTALTTSALSVSPAIEQTPSYTCHYDVTPVPAVPDNTLTGLGAPTRSMPSFVQMAKLAAAKSGTTRLWRAVEPEELADVVKYGDYNIHPNSTFKRFAFDEGSLDNFIKANPGLDYTKTFIDVPTENLSQMYRHADPGGVGKAIGIDVYEKPQFYDWFNKVEVLPK